MSDMSFNQAKQIVEQMELSELSLKGAVDNIDESTKLFKEMVEQQEKLPKVGDGNTYMLIEPDSVEKFCLSNSKKTNKKILILLLIIAANIGFIGGLLLGKYFV